MHKLKVLTISIILVMLLSLAGLILNASARPLQAIAPGLGQADSFAVLGGVAVTNTGASVINGDLGTYPGVLSTITGFPPGILVPPGTIHAADGVASQAQTDVTTAYNNLSTQVCTSDLTGQDLGGLTLTPGVYCFSSSAQLTGILKLDAQGNPNAVWVFQIGSALTTAPGSSVVFINGGVGTPGCNVFWKVSSSATIDTTTAFVGNILALQSITMNTSASLAGRALARNAAVTLDTNNIKPVVCVLPPTQTPLPATQTVIAPTLTAIAATQTVLAPTLTAIALTPTQTLPAPTLTAIAATETVIAATRTVVAPTLTAIAATQVPTLTAQAATQTAQAATQTPAPATQTPAPASTAIPAVLPSTGFDPQHVTVLSAQPAEKAYSELGDLWLEIPRLGVQMPIVGVPQTAGEWDVSWLGNQAGWLNGSAFPTWAGNSVLTGHVWNADNTAGPFRYINMLWWGDKVIVHAWGGQYIYEVRSVEQVRPNDTAAMMKHQTLPWVTLVTCRGYDQASNSYEFRVLVRAVLIAVK